MMDGSGVKEFKAALEKPLVVSVDGVARLVMPKEWTTLGRRQTRQPASLPLNNLTGMCSYIRRKIQDFAKSDVMLLVLGPDVVSLVGGLETELDGRGRPEFATSKCRPSEFAFGRYYDHESFLIALRSMFKQTDHRGAMLDLLASISDSAVRESLDNGIAQRVVVQRGLTTKEHLEVKNPWDLKPFRTFREVEQPTSEFILRLKEAEGMPMCALFEADGGVWREEAIASIVSYLDAQSLDVAVIG